MSIRFKKFDLNLLIALDTLLAEKNVTKAGDKIGLSQPAMSGALARLREHFQDDLFTRIGRDMYLTPKAESLVKPTREILLRIQATFDNHALFNPATSVKRYKVGMSDYCAFVLIPKILKRLEKEAPGVTIDVITPDMFKDEPIEKGDLDLLILPKGYYQSKNTLECELFDDRWVCISSRQNKDIDDNVVRKQYKELTYASISYDNIHKPTINQWQYHRHNLEENIRYTVDQFTLIPFYIEKTKSVAIIMGRLAQHLQQHLDIDIHPLPFGIPRLREHMHWHTRYDKDPTHSWLRNLIWEESSELRS